MLRSDPLLVLDRVRRACIAGRPLAPEDSAWLGRALTRYLEANETTLDAAMAIPSGWRTIRARAERDALLRIYAASVTAASARERGAQIRRDLLRYARSAFPHDRRKGARPEGARGVLFDILIASGGEVRSADRIVHVIEAQEDS